MAGILPAVFIVLVYEVFVTNLVAPKVQQQAVSVTRKMSASFPGLRENAAPRGCKVHPLGAG